MEVCLLDRNYLVDMTRGLLFRKGKKIPLGVTAKNKHIVCRVGGKWRKVHQVIFYQKHKYHPQKPMCIHHVNEIKTDNRISNLKEVAWGENIKLSYKPRKRTRRQVEVIGIGGGERRQYLSMNRAAIALKINSGIVSSLVSNNTHTTTDYTGRKVLISEFIGPILTKS